MHLLLVALSANSVFIRQGLTSIVTNYVNGVLSCSFERAIAADATQKRFDLNKAYTLFYATGPGSASMCILREKKLKCFFTLMKCVSCV